MTKIGLCICIISIVISGCSSTVEMTSAVDANRKIGESAATVYLKSGKEYDGRKVHVRLDSTQLVDTKTENTLRFHNRDIESIQLTHRGGGALEGFLFGGLGGGALGLTLGIGMRSGGDEGMGKGLLVITGLALGSVGGLALGVIKGHDYTFVFPEDSISLPRASPSEADTSNSK